jgi:hypothetical protein
LLEERKDAKTDAAPRMDAVYLYGVDVMSTKECLEYFKEYGPSYVEWINDSSCTSSIININNKIKINKTVSHLDLNL